jgi:RNA polymerase sigma-70 factor (ECF subfamily)
VYANKFVYDFEVCRDITQEAFFKIWENRQALDEEKGIDSLLYKSIKNRCLDYLKSLNVSDKYRLHIIKSISEVTEDSDQLEIEEIQSIFENTLDCFSETTKSIYKLKIEEHKKHKEIADYMGVSVKTVEYHLSLAKKELKKNIKNYLSI